jgi:hypothetical protein
MLSSSTLQCVPWWLPLCWLRSLHYISTGFFSMPLSLRAIATFLFKKKQQRTVFTQAYEYNSLWVLVAYVCNPSYLGGWDWKDCGWRPAQANSLRDLHLQNNHSKMDWRCVAQAVECLLLESKPRLTKRERKKKGERERERERETRADAVLHSFELSGDSQQCIWVVSPCVMISSLGRDSRNLFLP